MTNNGKWRPKEDHRIPEQHFGRLHASHTLLERQDTRNLNCLKAHSLPDGLQVDNEPTQELSGNYAWFAYALQRENLENF